MEVKIEGPNKFNAPQGRCLVLIELDERLWTRPRDDTLSDPRTKDPGVGLRCLGFN